MTKAVFFEKGFIAMHVKYKIKHHCCINVGAAWVQGLESLAQQKNDRALG